MELIHRDSLKSPFYDPSRTRFQCLTDSVRRSINHVKRFKSANPSPKSLQATMIPSEGDYLVKFSLGTPPTEILAVLDTSSNLTWTQCKPCPDCHSQRAPLFNPSASSTYKQIPCTSTECQSIIGSYCDSKQMGRYVAGGYGNVESYSEGDLAMDTMTLSSTTGRSISLHETIWGCAHHDDGYGEYNVNGTGILGLGAGPTSLLVQKHSALGGEMFSYCLAPTEQTISTLNLGDAGIVSGPGVVSTPLTIIFSSLYVITLEAISVGNERFELINKVSNEGNTIIYPGTMLMYLPIELYYLVQSAVEKAIHLQPAPPVEELSCYFNTSYFEAPTITVHLNSGDLQLNTFNTFLQVSENITCFAFAPVSDSPVLGNMVQRNFLVSYDLEGKTLSFKSTDCSK